MEGTLVRFAYAPSPVLPWAEAGHDTPAFGAALDRVFGDASEVHLLEHFTAIELPSLIADDPLVRLGNLSDHLGLQMGDPAPASMAELAAVYDFAAADDDVPPHNRWVYAAHG